MFRVPAEEIAGRLVAFQSLLKENGIDAAVIRQNADLYYYTGTVQDAHLVVPAAGEPLLMVRRDLTRAEEQSPIRPVVPLRSLSELASAVTSACGNEHPRRVGMELDVLPAALFFVYDENIFPRQQIVDVSTLIRRMRTVKSPWEIEMMRAAGAMSKRIADAVPELLREGIAEFELAAELEALARKAGHAGMLRCRTFNMEMSFGHILSGPNAAVPSYNDGPTGGPGVSPVFGQGGGYRKIRAGELVSVDTVTSCHGYFNDQTRNFSIGSPPDRLLDAYAFVREVSERFRDVAKPGVVTGKLFEQVWRWAEDAGWGVVHGVWGTTDLLCRARHRARDGRISVHRPGAPAAPRGRDDFRLRTENPHSRPRNCRPGKHLRCDGGRDRIAQPGHRRPGDRLRRKPAGRSGGIEFRYWFVLGGSNPKPIKPTLTRRP